MEIGEAVRTLFGFEMIKFSIVNPSGYLPAMVEMLLIYVGVASSEATPLVTERT